MINFNRCVRAPYSGGCLGIVPLISIIALLWTSTLTTLGATVHYWLKPYQNGMSGGDGHDEASAAEYTGSGLHQKLASYTTIPDLTVHFLPGDYLIGAVGSVDFIPLYCDPNTGAANRRIALIGVISPTGQRARLFKAAWPNTGWTKSLPSNWLIKCASYSGARCYLERIVIQDLDLDGNFFRQNLDGSYVQNQRAWTSEANATGWRSYAIEAWAQTGLIKGVRVRNFGSVGEVPSSGLYATTTAGIESFPISATTFDVPNQPVLSADPAFSPASSYSYPWVIEDCEVSDFRSVHGGYGTMVLAQVLQTARTTLTATPKMAIRRCQVRVGKEAIAFGTAGAAPTDVANTAGLSGTTTGRILIQDNIVLGAGSGFNTDTGFVGPITFDNNAFLDIQCLGYIGVADTSKDPASGFYWHDGYAFQDNIIRLRGRRKLKTWSDLCLNDYPNITSEQDSPLGRDLEPENNLCNGLVIQGPAGNVKFNGNDFTTWPSDNFYLPDTSLIGNAQYRMIWKVQGNYNHNCQFYYRGRGPVEPMEFTNTRLSTTAYDFNSFTPLASGTEPLLNYNSASAYASQHLQLRNASATLPSNFIPRGDLRRVNGTFTSSSRLHSVQEIQIGDVTYNAGTVTVKGRFVRHALRASGLSSIQTAAVQGKVVFLSYERRDETFPPLPTAAITLNSKTSDSNGIVSFDIPNLGGSSGLLRIKMWCDPPSNGNGTLEESSDIWAEYDFPLSTPGGKPVVEITAGPDVADDKNTATIKRVVIHAKRSFADSKPLNVEVSIDSGIYFDPDNGNDLAAYYSTAVDGDYYITDKTGVWTSISPYTSGTITIPANAIEGTVEVVVRADNVTEQNIITCSLKKSTNNEYAPGASSRINILIYDGPMWTAMQLDGATGVTTNSPPAAVNAGVVGAGGWTVQPQTVGVATWNNAYGYPELHGTLWVPPNAVPIDFGLTFRPNAISFRQSAAAKATMAGVDGLRAYKILSDGTGYTMLDGLSGGLDSALGISPSSMYIVGYSTLIAKQRPVLWKSGLPIKNLAAQLQESQIAEGQTLAVNDDGVACGYSTGFQGDTSLKRPFATGLQGASLTDLGYLPIPIGTLATGGQGVLGEGEGVARAVTRYAVAGGYASVAAGGFKRLTTPYSSAVVWRAASGLPGDPINLGRLERQQVGSLNLALDLSSEVLGYNSAFTAVGWSGNGSRGDSSSLATICFIAENGWKNLNDPHYVRAPGWVLRVANAISDTGVIVGNGELNGVPKGFILIPRAPRP